MRQTILGSHGYIGTILRSDFVAQGFEVLTPSIEDFFGLKKDWGSVYYCIGLTSDFRTRPFATIDAHVNVVSQTLQRVDFNSLVYLSSTRVYQGAPTTNESDSLLVNPTDPSHLYNLSKLTGESLCLSSGRTGIRIARLSNVIGGAVNENTFLGNLLAQAISGDVHLHSNLNSSKDYISFRDISNLLFKIANEGQAKIYNVANGKSLTTNQLLLEIGRFASFQIHVNPNGDLQTFPEIDTSLITKEFGHSPHPPLNHVEELLMKFKNNKEINFEKSDK